MGRCRFLGSVQDILYFPTVLHFNGPPFGEVPQRSVKETIFVVFYGTVPLKGPRVLPLSRDFSLLFDVVTTGVHDTPHAPHIKVT